MWILHTCHNFILGILFPKRCFLCKKENEIICNICLSNISLAVETPYDFIHSHFSYRDKNLKKIIHSAKYFHRKDLFEPLINKSIDEIKDKLSENKNYILIPIPMPIFRKMLRGYNQAEIISKIYSRKLNIPYSKNILFRKKDTTRQIKSKNKSDRLKNQKGSFVVNNLSEIKDKTIILVDDITTTGSTLNEARNVFIKEGVKDVIAVTLAH